MADSLKEYLRYHLFSVLLILFFACGTIISFLFIFHGCKELEKSCLISFDNIVHGCVVEYIDYPIRCPISGDCFQNRTITCWGKPNSQCPDIDFCINLISLIFGSWNVIAFLATLIVYFLIFE